MQPRGLAGQPGAGARVLAKFAWRARCAGGENRPCLVLAAVMRARPSGVLGPRQLPPCMRQRPLGMAGARQGQPVVRALAPQRGARLGLPRGLPLRSGRGRSAGFALRWRVGPAGGCWWRSCRGSRRRRGGAGWFCGAGAGRGAGCGGRCGGGCGGATARRAGVQGVAARGFARWGWGGGFCCWWAGREQRAFLLQVELVQHLVARPIRLAAPRPRWRAASGDLVWRRAQASSFAAICRKTTIWPARCACCALTGWKAAISLLIFFWRERCHSGGAWASSGGRADRTQASGSPVRWWIGAAVWVGWGLGLAMRTVCLLRGCGVGGGRVGRYNNEMGGSQLTFAAFRASVRRYGHRAWRKGMADPRLVLDRPGSVCTSPVAPYRAAGRQPESRCVRACVWTWQQLMCGVVGTAGEI